MTEPPITKRCILTLCGCSAERGFEDLPLLLSSGEGGTVSRWLSLHCTSGSRRVFTSEFPAMRPARGARELRCLAVLIGRGL